jgi:histidine triad (HIT) family protein
MSRPDDYNFYTAVALKSGAAVQKVFENDRILAFHHTKPAYKTHVVLIPKESVWDIRHVEDTSLFAEMLTVARNIIRQISQAELDAKGARIVTNVGRFQDSPHLHFHVVMGEKLEVT